MDFSPEQNSPTDRIAETDFYGRPVTRDSVVATMPTTTRFTPSHVFSELFGISSATLLSRAAIPYSEYPFKSGEFPL